MTILLEVDGLETCYGSSQVLFGMHMQIGAGEVATLLGRNGMGKTTTVRSLLGITPASSGSIRFRGRGAFCPIRAACHRSPGAAGFPGCRTGCRG